MNEQPDTTDVVMADGHDGIPWGWAVEINRACTEWLEARGLLEEWGPFNCGGNHARQPRLV